jgi:CRISPR/Cas system CSM-associated protein Csm3 (group 7 of RAMP superfamily)
MIKQDEKNGRVLGRILVSGELKLKTPLIIGSGDGDETDNDLLRDRDGLPFIPGTSWAGAVRDYFYDEDDSNPWFEAFFGSELDKEKDQEKEYQSALITSDLFLIDKSPYIPEYRTNVVIEGKTGTAEEGKLFDYEVIPAGKSFDFQCEIVLRQEIFHNPNAENTNAQRLAAMIDYTHSIITLLQQGQMVLGAKTNSGFGRVVLTNVLFRHFDFSNPEDRLDWFSGKRDLFPYEKEKNKPAGYFEKAKKSVLDISGSFFVEDSIIIREYLENDPDADYRSFHSNNKAVLPGTSLKGVIRQRAAKIFNTLGIDQNKKAMEQYLNQLFGWVETNGKNGDLDSAKALRGRVSISESIIEGGREANQTRIKIDYFTGGVLEHALFSEKPIWSHGKAVINLNLRIKKIAKREDDQHQEKNEEILTDAAIILQVMKDLWDGDLPVGGEASIGRGRLKGNFLQIDFGEKRAILARDGEKLMIQDEKKILEKIESAWKAFLDAKEVSQ